MNDDEDLDSLSEASILKHSERKRPFELAAGTEDAQLLEEHIQRYLGDIAIVFHELISDLVHVDVHWIQPTERRPYHTLVTTGMSDIPMTPPPSESDCKYAELLIELPADWPLSAEAFNDEANYWPVRLLKSLARFPHEYETYLWWCHTVPNGDPPTPFHESVGFAGALIVPAVNVPGAFHRCAVSDAKEVCFFAVVPLYQEEMDYKLRKGTDALLDRFDAAGVTELLDPKRRNVAYPPTL